MSDPYATSVGKRTTGRAFIDFSSTRDLFSAGALGGGGVREIAFPLSSFFGASFWMESFFLFLGYPGLYLWELGMG